MEDHSFLRELFPWEGGLLVSYPKAAEVYGLPPVIHILSQHSKSLLMLVHCPANSEQS